MATLMARGVKFWLNGERFFFAFRFSNFRFTPVYQRLPLRPYSVFHVYDDGLSRFSLYEIHFIVLFG